jgi:Fe-S-cluster containining protein
MNPLDIFVIIAALIIFYLAFARQFVWRFRKFKCLRCGHCCRLRVNLSKKDIERLEKAGKKNFIKDTKWLKRINGYCMFLKIENGKAGCSVYNNRPEVCRWWPLKRFTCDTRCKSYSGFKN